MSIDRRVLSLILGVSLFALGTSVYAAKGGHPGKPDGGPQPNSDTSDCQIDFEAVFSTGNNSDAQPYLILGDSVAGGVYPNPDDSKDKSGAFTGSFPGLRFDTNGINRLEQARDTRALTVNIAGTSLLPGGADFRFQLNTGGLDLCGLEGADQPPENPPLPVSGDVPMVLVVPDLFDSSAEGQRVLYGCITHGGDPIIPDIGPLVRVTRLFGVKGAWDPEDAWTIEGTTACLQSGHDYATGTDTLLGSELSAHFLMTITAQ